MSRHYTKHRIIDIADEVQIFVMFIVKQSFLLVQSSNNFSKCYILKFFILQFFFNFQYFCQHFACLCFRIFFFVAFLLHFIIFFFIVVRLLKIFYTGYKTVKSLKLKGTSSNFFNSKYEMNIFSSFIDNFFFYLV